MTEKGPDIKSMEDEALANAWQKFCETLRTAGGRVFKKYNPSEALHRADGFRYLTQNLGQAFDLALETKNTKYPQIHTFCTPFCKLGGDNADCIYQQAWIDGESTYKISGNLGTSRLANFAVQGPRPTAKDYRRLHEPFGDVPEANILSHNIERSSDGDFELYIGGPKRGKNWLPTTLGSRKLFIRQFFDDWEEVPARMTIERIGMNEPMPMPLPEDMIRAMDWAADFMTGLMNDWPDWPYDYAADVDPKVINKFPSELREIENPAYNAESDKLRGRTPQLMCWELEEDEALIIEFDNHDGFWMMTNMGVFFNSMDYLYRPVSYTPSRTSIDPDGKVRMVLCHEDPGYHNWIDNQGFKKGHLMNRNLMSDKITDFHTRKVRRSELSAVLPVEMQRVSSTERENQMRERFHAIQRRYCG